MCVPYIFFGRFLTPCIVFIFVLAGDTTGYIRVYDIEDYYSTYGSVPANSKKIKPRHFEKFPFLRLQQSIEKKFDRYSKFLPVGGAEFGNAPLLLNCFRAHIGPVLKISYSNERNVLVTAARKGLVRLWSVAGTYLGSLDTTGSADVLRGMTPGTGHLPPDIRTVASPLTLYVGISLSIIKVNYSSNLLVNVGTI